MNDSPLEYFRNIASLWSGFTALMDRERRIVAAAGQLFFPHGAISDPKGCFVEELFGCTDGSGDLYKPRCGTREQCAWCGLYQVVREAFEKNDRVEKEVALTVREEGLFRYYDIRAVAAPFHLGGEGLFILSLEDITDRRRRILMEKLFYHDVLNTVSSLTMNISLMQESVDSEEVRKFAESLERITDHLTDEIQRQRLISLAESGRLEIEKAIINLPEFLGEILKSFDQLREKKGRQLVLETEDPKTPGMVIVTDKTLLRRVVFNLVKNALEAVTEGDSVTVTCHRSQDNAVISVCNPGVMLPEVKSRVFHQFFSTKGQSRGLGTYSVKLLTENYLKGKVSFSSDEAKGTVFTIELPDFRNHPKQP
jgi:signal transduction histidine kinase